MVVFIDAHRDAYGVEPICAELPIAPSTYHLAKAREADPTLRPARAQRDAGLCEAIQRVWDENFQVYGTRKVWQQLNREAPPVARCTVRRLMRKLGLQGVVRGRTCRTTIPQETSDRPRDLVDRNFTATRPNQLWVSESDLCRDLARLRVRRLRDRRVCPAHCRLAGVHLAADGSAARCPRAGNL